MSENMTKAWVRTRTPLLVEHGAFTFHKRRDVAETVSGL